jgi:hypothetical protein
MIVGGVIPNLESRYFWEDIPYGLCVLKNFGDIFGVPIPNTEKIIRWAQKFMGIKFINSDNTLTNIHLTGAPGKYGFTTKDDLVATSLPKLKSKF